jgi:4-amino-4-deoxy-L-arabinose transferase-like glycosyltransferase
VITQQPSARGRPGGRLGTAARILNGGAGVERSDRSAFLGHASLVAVLALAAVLNTNALGQNGYANTFYSAAARSMLGSLHNFLFVSFDPGGLVMVDKPPLGLWLQTVSASLFGFGPLSLMLPEAIAGVAAVGALYLIVQRRFGWLAGLISGATLAVFPSFVAVSRSNNVDAPLILLLVLACGCALRATETGRLRMLLGAAALVGLAFNTKTLAAYTVVPGIALAYLLCAPGTQRKRLAHLLAAGLVLGAVSLAWIAVVELTPASQRPFVGGSADNSELGLAFVYNGFGRVGGQFGGPGAPPSLFFAPPPAVGFARAAASTPLPPTQPAPAIEPVRKRPILHSPVPFGGPPGPSRLFEAGLDDQGSWLLPFGLVGLLAVALTRPGRRDPRLAAAIVLGGFFVVELLVLSFSRGIVHPYYVSALGPGLAAMTGAGAVSLGQLGGRKAALLASVGIALTVGLQVHLLHEAHYMRPWVPVLIALAALGLIALVVWRGRAMGLLAGLLAVLLFAPLAYSLTTWWRPVNNTFPAAGPRAVGGSGGVGVDASDLAANRKLLGYVLGHGGDGRFELLTQASLTAAVPILLGVRAAALGGYGGVDPALDGHGLGRLVARGEARYVLIGGPYAYLGGNRASQAAERVCPTVGPALWRLPGARFDQGLYLLDCAGRAGALERQPR